MTENSSAIDLGGATEVVSEKHETHLGEALAEQQGGSQTDLEGATEDVSDSPQEAPGDKKPANEAAKYRLRLRETEQQRDALAERLSAAQRAIVEHELKTAKQGAYNHQTGGRGVAYAGMHDAGDFWTHVQLADVLTDGNVDAAKVKAAVAGLMDTKPHLFKPTRSMPDASEIRGYAEIRGGDDEPSWSRVLSGKVR